MYKNVKLKIESINIYNEQIRKCIQNTFKQNDWKSTNAF